jgi:hypothetical protein
VERDELVQAAERALFDAEQAYRADGSETNRQRIKKAWVRVQEARHGERPEDQSDPGFPLPSPNQHARSPPDDQTGLIYADQPTIRNSSIRISSINASIKLGTTQRPSDPEDPSRTAGVL